MKTEELLVEILTVFPFREMPAGLELRFHRTGCPQCEYLSNDLEEFRGKTIGEVAIRQLHQEMSCLSAQGWAWILPHYLRFCLSKEADFSRMETEFLLYSLSPAEQFRDDTKIRLSLLNMEQISCLIHFVEWLEMHPHWSEYCMAEIQEAKTFLQVLSS